MSTLHSNVEPASDAENRNGDGPESIVVSGAVVSTVKVRDCRRLVGVSGGVGGPHRKT